MAEQNTDSVGKGELTAEGQALDNRFQQAFQLHQKNRLAEAQALYQQILDVDPRHFDSLHLNGVIALQNGNLELAVRLIRQANDINPNVAAAHNNLGSALADLGHLQAALISYRTAITLQPDYLAAYLNLGLMLKALNRWDEALLCFEQVLQIDGDSAAANTERGILLEYFHRDNEALASYAKAFAIDPDYPFLLGLYLTLKARFCDWDLLAQKLSLALTKIVESKPVIFPLSLILFFDDPQAHKIAAQVYAAYQYKNVPSGYVFPILPPKKKLRLAYYSADFREHPTAHLMVELFEQQDREHFELYAFYFGPKTDDLIQGRIAAAFDHFFHLDGKTAEEIIQLSRQSEIDIAVDLMGHVSLSMGKVFHERAAPIQVNYLGYPGTTGIAAMDYILVDKTVLPVENQPYVSEKAVYMPHCYQVNCDQASFDQANAAEKAISAAVCSRQSEGLPATGFVFCCFNYAAKIMPEVFDVWMEILQAVEGSVLWLFERQPIASENLRNEAAARGVDSNRLVFARLVDHKEHLVRHRLADLFLDTLPYNAHTTTSDALLMGLPVLTCQGKAFAGRVAASLLNTLDLPELVTDNYQDYAAKAIALATDPQRLQALKEKLASNRLNSPLFNPRLFARHLETAYQQMYALHVAGLPPEVIEVAAISTQDSHDPVDETLPADLEADFFGGFRLHQEGTLAEAKAIYQRILALYPKHFDSLHLMGVLESQQGNRQRALRLIGQAIALRPDIAAAYNNLASVLAESDDSREQALEKYHQAIALEPDYFDAWFGRGITYEELNRVEEALSDYQKALTLCPEEQTLLASYLHLKARLCDWQALPQMLIEYQARIVAGKPAIKPYDALTLYDQPELHYKTAKVFVAVGGVTEVLAYDFAAPSPATSKIRLGYYSADFREHATSHLISELIERHDRGRFELYAFYFGPQVEDQKQARIAAACDHFLHLEGRSDTEIVTLSRQLGIDIAVDLMGHTRYAKMKIFMQRCAPIQVNYLGYPGTSGITAMDYIIADKVVMPVENQAYCSEKVVYLPHCYQVNPAVRQVSSADFSRQAEGLPATGFVFCCFNYGGKIMPQTFDIWMNILQEVEDSVLWLLGNSLTQINNLRQEADNRGVDANRLVFARFAPPAEHLARHRLAGLFLDTLPYNAHTTTSDALWMDLPVLTCRGQAFAGRVAASLLDTLGLFELVTDNYQDYQQKAIELATHPERLQALKVKIKQQRTRSPLFNPELFARHIEAAYQQMYDRHAEGLPPEMMIVKEILL